MKTKSKKIPQLTRQNFAGDEIWKDVSGCYHILIDDGNIEECDSYMLLFDPKNRQISALHLIDGNWTRVTPYYTSVENWKYGNPHAPDMPVCKHCGKAMCSSVEQEAHPRCEPVEA